MELFAKLVNGLQLFNIFVKNYILDVLQSFNYTSDKSSL